MIVGQAHAYPVINAGQHLVTNIDIIKTADINAKDAWLASPDMMHVNPTGLAEIMFGNRRISLIERQ
jgi:hypothetical protein